MPRHLASLPEGQRPSDYVSVGVLAKYCPRSVVDDALEATGRQSQRQRELPAHLMVYYIMALGLYMHVSSKEVLATLLQGLNSMLGRKHPLHVPGYSAISKARTRLGEEPMRLLHDRLVRPVATRATVGAFHGEWRLVSIDGSCLEMAESEKNAAYFGKPSGSGQTRSCPQLRFVCLVESGTHILMNSKIGPYRTSEAALAKQVVEHLDPTMLCLADRLFYSYALWQKAASTGAQLLWRVKADLTLPCLKTYKDGSYLSELPKPRGCHDAPVRVRVAEYSLEEVSSSEPSYRVITTVLRPGKLPAKDMARLYHERWEIENALDELKVHLKGARVNLRSKLPELVRQEFYGLMMTHCAVRALMHEAAVSVGRDPDTVSYVHSVNVIRRWLPDVVASPPPVPTADAPMDDGGHPQ